MEDEKTLEEKKEYYISEEGSKIDKDSASLYSEEKWILKVLVLENEPITTFAILRKVKEKFKEEMTHYKTSQMLITLLNKGYVRIRE